MGRRLCFTALLFFVFTVGVVCGGPLSVGVTTTIAKQTSLVAGFTYAPSSPYVNDKVTFTDTSTGSVVTWKWDFGDASGLATVKNPVHVYKKEGSYTVTHTVADKAGATKTITKTITVTVPTYVVAITVKPTSVGTITGAGSYHAGDSVKCTALSKTGYVFCSWTGDFKGTAVVLQFKMPAHNVAITAVFAAVQAGPKSPVK